MNVLQSIRTNARNNQKSIIKYLDQNYLNRESGRVKSRPLQQICLFCSARNNITLEHVLPRWVFEKDSNRFFNTTINGLSHKYNQTTISACAKCNNNLLSTLEKRILMFLEKHKQMGCFFTNEETTDIICWFELLDYKYQVFSLITRFRAIKGKRAIEFLSNFSLSVLDPNIEYSPVKVMRNLRRALYRITVKSKDKMLNSLVTFKTKNSDIHFFHKNNDFLFLELPKYNLALLYFYERQFENVIKAKNAAMEIINQHY
jgi:hypothetical protein